MLAASCLIIIVLALTIRHDLARHKR